MTGERYPSERAWEMKHYANMPHTYRQVRLHLDGTGGELRGQGAALHGQIRDRFSIALATRIRRLSRIGPSVGKVADPRRGSNRHLVLRNRSVVEGRAKGCDETSDEMRRALVRVVWVPGE